MKRYRWTKRERHRQIPRTTWTALVSLALLAGCSTPSSATLSDAANPTTESAPAADSQDTLSIQIDSTSDDGSKQESASLQSAESTEASAADDLPFSAVKIGPLDRAPIRLMDSGWVVLRDGQYGYLNRDGEWVIRPRYDSMQFLGHAGQDGLGVGVYTIGRKDRRDRATGSRCRIRTIRKRTVLRERAVYREWNILFSIQTVKSL